jgi:(4S)-4-hydroxy-5-phosphonooxypentane-2,3-dione isomerase
VYVVIARYTVQEGEGEAVADLLRAMTELSLAEPGCIVYRVQRSIEDASVLVLYEVYEDEQAYGAHLETPHFQKHILEQAVPRLVSREREFFTSLD